jgi:hypothetical protein
VGSKQPKIKHPPHPHKQPTFNQLVEAAKQPKVAVDPEEYWRKRPSWRLHWAQMCDPFGWHILSAEKAAEIRDKLAGFESRTWAEILVTAKKQNHLVSVGDLEPEARKRLSQLGIFVDQLASLHLSGTERVYGVLEEGIFSVLWWDPNHEVCKSQKKHT